MCDTALISSIATMLAKTGCNTDTIDVRPWTAGGNNRVFIVSNGGTKVVAKWYYSDGPDRRDRLQAEWSFLNYARNAGIACVPRPISRDPAKRLALYDFVEGRKLGAEEIGRYELEQAASFFRRLNEPSVLAGAPELPAASEACFSIADHFALVDGRLGRLQKLVPESEIDHEASVLVSSICDAWERHKTAIKAGVKEMSLDDPLEPQDRCVSPSDFGFHNILIRANGELCFLDFEYAGWDDPAKMAGDFFYQPAVPVDPAYFECFIDATLGCSGRAERMKRRVHLLRPIFGIKWCCIVLNIFVAELASHTRFANPSVDIAQRKREQLQKAKVAFARVWN